MPDQENTKNIRIHWEHPRDSDGNVYDQLAGYEIHHNFPGFVSPHICDPSVNSSDNIPLPEGIFSFGVCAVNTDGLKSKKVIHNFEITNVIQHPEVTRDYSVPLGGTISTDSYITTAGIFKTESATGWSFASAGSPRNFTTFQNGHANRYSQDCSDIPSLDFSSMPPHEQTIQQHYIFFDYSDSNDPLKLIKYEDVVYSTSNNLDVGYFYDSGDGDVTSESTFVTKTGTASVAAGSNDVVGTGTSFTTEYAIDDIIYFSSTKAAKVTYIDSNTGLTIDRAFNTAITDSTIKVQGYTPDFNFDAVLYAVRNDQGTFIIFPSDLTIDPDVFTRSRVATLQPAPNLLNFDATPTLTTSYTNLVLTAVGNGFLSPKFKITGTGFNNSEISQTADSSFQDPTSGKTYVKTLDKVDAFVTTDLDFTVTVTEAADEDNTDLQSTQDVTIPFIKDGSGSGSGGSDAKVVQLTVDDYSIIYNADGTTPSPSGNMTLTASSQNFTDPYFKFTGDGIVDEDEYTDGSGDSDTFTFTIPTGHFSDPKSLRVGVAEAAADTTEIAFDSISITAVKPGATGPRGIDGMTFVITNEAHVFNASVAGAVSSYAGSGTIIEVYEGGTELVYDGTGTSNSRWKTTEAATNITVGTKTDSGDYLTVGNHSGVADGTDESKIVYTITGKRADGTSFTAQAQQSFTKSKKGTTGDTGATGAQGIQGVKGDDAAGVEYIFAVTADDDTDPTDPSNSWGFDNPNNSQGWYDGGPSLTTSNKALWRAQRDIEGTPATGATVSDTWSDPTVVGRYADDGTDGADGADGDPGATGAVGKKTATGYLYYNTQQASAPSAPSNSSVTYTFSSGTMAGGVIGTGATNWSLTAPAASGGTSGSKMYYIYWNAEETTSGGGTAAPSFDSTVHTATNFTGLVRFNGTNKVEDGLGGELSFGSGGTTVIDGGKITTGTISADRITTDLLRVTGDAMTGGTVGGWTIDSSAIFSGTKDTTGYTTGGITFNSLGSIHAKEFYVDTDGNAFFAGDISAATGTFNGSVQVGSTTLTETNTLNENTTKANIGLSNINNPGSAVTPIAAGDVNTNVTNIAGGVIQSGYILAARIQAGTITGEKIETGNNALGATTNKFAFNGPTEYSGYTTVIGATATSNSKFAGLFFGGGNTSPFGAQTATTNISAGVFANSASTGAATRKNRALLASDITGSKFEDDSGRYCSLAHPDYAGKFWFAGGVKSATITNGGSGYTSAPTVTFSSSPYGTTATGTATVSGGAVTSIAITNKGTGYTDPNANTDTVLPTISFSGGGGTAAAATAVVTDDYVKIGFNNYALYYVGSIGVGPFTGSHDALLSDSEICEVGDILVDQGVAYAKSISDVITNVTRSTSTNQKSVIGVFVLENPNHVPAALAKEVISVVGEGPTTTTDSTHIIDPIHDSIMENKTIVAMNSLGEGQVNVCGENGDIEIGDLISSSSTTGKGMKQDDDIVRSCTVGKAREAVTFASASTVKQIACIYMCG